MTAIPSLSEAMSSLQEIVGRVQQELIQEQGVQQRIEAERRNQAELHATNNEIAQQIAAKRKILADLETQAAAILVKAKTQASAIENDANTKARAILQEAEQVKAKSLADVTAKEQAELQRINAEITAAHRALDEVNYRVHGAQQKYQAIVKSAAEIANAGADK